MSETGFPIFLARGIIRKESCFCTMDTPPRTARYSRKLWIKSLTDYLWYLLGPLIPIENIFHPVGVCLRKDAIMKKIKRETYEQFCNRVTNTLHNFSSDIIDRTIASVPKLIDAVIKMKGQEEHHWGMVIFSGKV